MISAQDWLKQQNQKILSVLPRLLTGTVKNTTPLQVDAGGETLITPSKLGWWQPTIGQPVWLLSSPAKTLALGAANDLPTLAVTGTVTAASAGTATVVLDYGGTFTLPNPANAAPAAKVWIAWSPSEWGKGVIGGVVGSAPTTQQPPATTEPEGNTDQPPSTTAQGTTTIPAVEIKTRRNGSWRTDTTKAFQGDWSGTGVNTGFFFYGDGFRQLAGVTVKKVEMFQRRREGGDGGTEQMRMRRHTGKTSATVPTITADAITGPSIGIDGGGWYEIGALIGWAQIFVDSGVGGIAAVDTSKTNYASYAGLSGTGRDPQSGSLRITWARS